MMSMNWAKALAFNVHNDVSIDSSINGHGTWLS